MNALLAATLATVLAFAAGTWWGMGLGADKCEAEAAREERIAAVAMDAAASAVAKIKVVNRTVQQEVQREISERVVYRDCQHSPEQLRRINSALTGQVEPAGGGLVPRADALDRPELRGDHSEAGGGRRPVP